MTKKTDSSFNLLDEAWIRVLRPDCSVQEVSLVDALVNAHEYRDLAGEIKPQDVAVLRLLLAVLHSVFREGEEIERWRRLWENKRFPKEPICEYLETYRDRFFLFHPEHPFFQRNEAETGTKFSASKLNGMLSESENKKRLFQMRENSKLSYSEAARWLLYVNGFDDSSLKPPRKSNLPKPGVGWLGKLGIVYAAGSNLFETLMLNFVLLQNGLEPWGEPRPVWEQPDAEKQQRTKIILPDNQAELLTLQSRLILLVREEGKVTDYKALSGDWFPEENAFSEQMTVWKNNKPKKHRHEMWRDFESLLTNSSGVVKWVSRMKDEEILPDDMAVSLRTVSVQYGPSNSKITEEYGDSITFTASMLKDRALIDMVSREVARCEKMGNCINCLASNIAKAQGKKISVDFYSLLDIPFRKWVFGINKDNMQEKQQEWVSFAKKTAFKVGITLAKNAGPAAFVGREKNGKHYSTSEALLTFYMQMGRIA